MTEAAARPSREPTRRFQTKDHSWLRVNKHPRRWSVNQLGDCVVKGAGRNTRDLRLGG